jgi:phosphatidylserine decarboxylase
VISRTSNAVPLPVYDRKTGTRFQEFLSGSPATYEARPHRSVTNIVQSHPAYDWLVSMYQNTRLSARKIEPFIRKHHIDMDEFEPGPYETYAAFFWSQVQARSSTFPAASRRHGSFRRSAIFRLGKIES